ncbi:MAG TPA: TVP38/TMEM64 family protein [Candidatus Nanoarchaeia archaeon]|nr:TVP38/TMEM64 family protein [Candidatus Nanoarchaeia archaeon]
MHKRKIHISWGLIIFLTILIGFSLYSYFSGGVVSLLMGSDVDSLLNYLSSFEHWTVFIFIFLVILEVLFALIPPMVLYMAGGILFGPFLGGVYGLIGNILGAGMAFQISRHWIREYVQQKVPNRIKKRFDKASEKHGPLAVFVLRINPLTTTDLVSYIAGISKMKFWKFILSTALGLLPLVFLESYLGESIKDNPLLFKMFIILSILYVVAFVGIYMYSKIRRKNKKDAKLPSNKER